MSAGGLRHFDRFRCGKPGDRGHDGRSSFDSGKAGAQDFELLFVLESRGLPERTQQYDTCATVIEQPAAVPGHEPVVQGIILAKAGCDRRHYALPVHDSASSGFAIHAMCLSCAGKTGGRTESGFQ